LSFSGVIFPKGYIEQPVEVVFYRPMAAYWCVNFDIKFSYNIPACYM